MAQGLPDRTRPSIAVSSRWVILNILLSKPLQFGTNLLLAWVLGPVLLGSLSLANVTAVTIGGIAGLGLGDAASKFMAEHFRRDRETATQIASLILWVSLLLSASLFGAAWLSRTYWASYVFPSATVDVDTIVALCLSLGFINLLLSLSTNVLTGMQLFRDLTVLGALQASLIFVSSVGLAFWYGVSGALVGSILSAVICVLWALNHIRAVDRRLFAWPGRRALTNLGRVFHFSLPSWLALFVINPINVLTFSYLSHQPAGTQELGLFNTANGLKMLVAMLPGIIGSVLGPAIMEEAGEHGSPAAYKVLINNAVSALACLTIPLAILLVFLSDAIFLLYGTEYSGASSLFMPLAAGVAISVLSAPMQFAVVARNRTWTLLCISTAKAIAFLCLALWWIPGGLSAGLAWAWVVAEIGFAAGLTELCRRLGFVHREASIAFYGYTIAILLILSIGIATPSLWRRILAIPLAVVAGAIIVRVHPAAAVWIVGSLPKAFRAPVRRSLDVVLLGALR